MRPSLFVLSLWIEIFGIFCYLRALLKKKLRVKIPGAEGGERPEPIELKDMLRTIRVMKGTMAGEDESLGALKKMVQKQLYLSTVEFSVYFFALRHPRLFLIYVSKLLFKKYEDLFRNSWKEGGRLFFVHNFIGGKTAILSLISGFINKGIKSIVFVDEAVFLLMKKMYGVILKSIGIEEKDHPLPEMEIFSIKGKFFMEYFGPASSQSEIIFLNSRKKENLKRALDYINKNSYNLVMIPETAAGGKKKMLVKFLGKDLLIPGSIEPLLKEAAFLISIIPDASENLMQPEFKIKEYETGPGTEASVLMQSVLKRCENLAFVRPELYLPFNFPSMWNNLFPYEKEENTSIIDVLPWREKCLILLSDGQFLIGSRGKLKEII